MELSVDKRYVKKFLSLIIVSCNINIKIIPFNFSPSKIYSVNYCLTGGEIFNLSVKVRIYRFDTLSVITLYDRIV